MKLFSQIPAGFDGFGGGSQKRLAERILEEIVKPTPFYCADGSVREYAHVWALEGVWGSGKSNVLKMVKRRVQDEKPTIAFVDYDVWEHRQELTRKSILEKIVGDLVSANALPRSFLERLYGLTGESVSKYIESVNKFQWMPAIAVLILIAVSLLKGKLGDFPLSLIWVLGLTLAGSVLKDLFYLHTGISGALSRLIAAMRWKSPDVHERIRSYKNDTTVQDFIEFLHDIGSELAKKDKKKTFDRLIVAFDNLDRIDDDEIRCFWAAIHVLFAEENSNRPSNIQVIISYDRKRIWQAFGGAKTGDEVIRKTVEIVFDMPAVVVADWARFIEAKLRDAFSESARVSDADILQTVKVFDWLHSPDDLMPRGLIAFVNDISVLYSIVDKNATSIEDRVPLPYVAFYILGWRRFEIKDTEVNPPLLGKKTVPQTPQGLTEAEPAFEKDKLLIDKHNKDMLIVSGGFIIGKSRAAWKWYINNAGVGSVYMAAVVYQLPLKRAREVLLYQTLGVALDSGDANALRTLCRIPGFHRMYSTIIQQIRDLGSAAVAIEGIDTEDSLVYWDEFYDMRRDEIVMKHGAFPSLSKGEVALFRHTSRWQDFYMRLVVQLSSNDKAMFNESIEVQFARAVEAELKQVGRTLVGSFSHAPLPLDKFLSLARVAKTDFELMNCRCNPSEMETYLRTLVSNNSAAKCDGVQYLDIATLNAMPGFRGMLMSKLSEDGVPAEMHKIVEETLSRYRAGKL